MTPLQPIKGKLPLYLLLLIIAAGLMAMLKYCSHPESTDNDTKSGGDTLDIAIEISPIALSTRADTLGGFYYDLMRHIAASENIPVKFIPFSQIDNAFDRLEQGRYDIVIADLPVTTAMKEKFLFTDPIALDREILVQLKDSVSGKPKAMTQHDLRGDTVWIPAGSPFRDRLINLSHEIGDTIYILEDPDYASEQLVMLVALGDIPRAVVNEQIARPMLKQYPRLDLSVDISFTQFQSWAVNHNRPDLRDSLNIWLQRHKAYTDQLRRRY